jgi:hypothetical protein
MGQKEGEGILGKYILIEAPNFNNARSEADAMSSYLRLGAVKDLSIAANPGAPRASGEDLAALVTTFIDDTRVREGCPDYLPPSVRQEETAKLHIKGGWRDHSDGNRITTTRGDKVEVIKGNYRMLILGRQNDESGWDVSGGHVGESGITFQGSSEIRWVQNYDGTWKVTEETIKGDVYTMYMGDVKDEYWGNLKTSSTGSEAPSLEKPNPDIEDRTWAKSIASYTGSAALPVPAITDETWAVAISSTTNVTDMTSDTTAVNITDTTTATNITSSTTATAVTDTTTAATMTSTTTAGMITNLTTVGMNLDTTIGNTVSVIVGSEAEIVVGNMAELTVGAQESITIGAVLDLTIALMAEITIAGRIEYSAGPVLDLSPKKDEMAALKQTISAMQTNIATMATFLCANIQLG